MPFVASNVFAVFPNNTLVTPSLSSQTILPGVTRQSILELAAKECGMNVVEGRLTISDLQNDAIECFCCGTGACITPVGCISVFDSENPDGTTKQDIIFGDGQTPGPVTQRLYKMLTDIFTGSDAELANKYRHWIHVVEP